MPLLKKLGYNIGKTKLQRLIRKLDIRVTSFSKKSGKYSSYRGTVGKVAPNRINRRFDSSILHQKITTDTTEFKYYERNQQGKWVTKKAYLNPFLDLCNREVLSYRFTRRATGAPVMEALEEAIAATADCPFRRTFHSDQGWAYQMNDYVARLKEHRIFQSMSRKGNCIDNSPMESFFGILKQEIYNDHTYHSFEELEAAIDSYIIYYNQFRIKEKLNWLSPVDYRLTLQEQEAA